MTIKINQWINTLISEALSISIIDSSIKIIQDFPIKLRNTMLLLMPIIVLNRFCLYLKAKVKRKWKAKT
jgi:hypothetical protein